VWAGRIGLSSAVWLVYTGDDLQPLADALREDMETRRRGDAESVSRVAAARQERQKLGG